MEWNEAMIAAVARANPGDFAIYQLRDGALRTLYRSESLPGLSGMDEAEYRALTAEDAGRIVLEGDRPQVAARLSAFAALPEGTDVSLAYRIAHKTRGFAWILAKARVIGKLDGCPLIAAAFHSGAFGSDDYERLLDCLEGITYVIDRHTYELLYANGTAMRTWDRIDFSGKTCYRHICGREKPCPWCSVPLMKNGFYHTDASYSETLGRWFRIDCRDVDWFGREAVAVYGSDVTEQFERQRSLELDKHSLEATVDNLPVGIGVCRIEKNGKIEVLAINPLIHELLGVGREGFASADREMLSRVHPDDRAGLLAEMRRCAQPDAAIRREYRFRRPGSEDYRWYRLTARTVPQDDGTMVFSCLTDVTDEKNAGARIARAEAREHSLRRIYEASIEAAELFVYEYDIPSRTVTLMDNEYTRRRSAELGFPHVIENVPDVLLDRVDEKNAAVLKKLYADIGSGAPEAKCVIRFAPAPGEKPLTLKLNYTAVFDEAGRPVKAYGTSQNISKRMAETDAYWREMDYFAAENAENLIARGRHSLTGNRVLSYRPASGKAMDLSGGETYDEACARFVRMPTYEEDRARLGDLFSRQNLLARFAGGAHSFTCEYRREKADRTTVWARAEARTFENPISGDVECFIYTYDITRRHLEQLIVQRTTELGYDYMGLIDPRHNRLACYSADNAPGTAAVTEWSDYEAYLRASVLDTVPEPQRGEFLRCAELPRMIGELQRAGRYSFTYDQLGGDGTQRRKLIQFCFLDESKESIFFAKSDVTRQYENEQEQLRRMREALASAERANAAKTEFVSRISHDIRTPISIIRSMTDFAFEDIREEERLRGDLERIRTANTFLLSLINDVLDISKIDSGKIELNPAPYPYGEHSENIRNMLEPMCAAKGLKCVMERRRKTGVIVADRIRINQITLNLISNAVKYTPPGGTVTYISDSEDLPDARIRFGFELRDTGIGMSREFQEKMFEPFTQEYDNPARPKGLTGTGLGLSIVKKMVDLMGGAISVESAPGQGTTVRCSIVFPDAQRDPRYRGWQDAGGAAEAPAAPLRGKVLLAEDNPVNTEIAVRILESFGLRVDCAENGAKALERFSASAPGEYGAILMDIQMPLMNGYEAARAIRALSRPDAAAVPILAMTADAFAESVERSARAGMNEHLTKPLEPARIRTALERCMGR